jgi:cytochrome c biogenesis protein CcmG, thiol:disulfide interchange protein DsbE
MRRHHRHPVLPLLLAALALLAACVPERVEVGREAPAYSAPVMGGETLSLGALRGEVVLVNIWATWCAPCRREMPALEEMYRQLAGEGLRVVAVSIDEPGAEREIDDFVRELGLSFTIAHDAEKRIVRTFQTIGVPETFLIGRDGTLLHHWRGRIDPHSPSVRLPVHAALDGRVALDR